MSQVLGEFQANNVNVPGSGEIAILVSGFMSMGQVTNVNVRGQVKVSPGASVTGYTVSLYQGNGITGTLVDAHDAVTASTIDTIEYDFEDSTSWLNQLAPGGQYTVSIICTGAAGASTVNYVDMTVESQ